MIQFPLLFLTIFYLSSFKSRSICWPHRRAYELEWTGKKKKVEKEYDKREKERGGGVGREKKVSREMRSLSFSVLLVFLFFFDVFFSSLFLLLLPPPSNLLLFFIYSKGYVSRARVNTAVRKSRGLRTFDPLECVIHTSIHLSISPYSRYIVHVNENIHRAIGQLR